MQKIDLGQTVGILANIGVIAGIVFLGIELQQNNALLAAEFRASSLSNRLSLREKALDPQIAELLVRAYEGAELSAAERVQLGTINMMQLELWEWTDDECALGLGELPDEGAVRG